MQKKNINFMKEGEEVEEAKGYSHVGGANAEAEQLRNQMVDIKNAAAERGELINEMALKSEQMKIMSKQFLDDATALNNKAKGWF